MYQPNKNRKENNNPLPLFEVDGYVVTSRSFMHGEWWYVVNDSWECESVLTLEKLIQLGDDYVVQNIMMQK
jgi:hypothetical protein